MMECLVNRNGVFSVHEIESGYFIKKEREELKEAGFFEYPNLSVITLKDIEIEKVNHLLDSIEEINKILNKILLRDIDNVKQKTY